MRNPARCAVQVGVIVSLIAASCPAGVTVTQNVTPGATSWPGTPLLQTVTNPVAQVAVGEGFNAVGGCTNYTQTFTVAGASHILQRISLYAGGGSGTGAGTNVTLRLFDLGPQTAPNPSPYTPGTDLFNAGNGLAVSYAPQPDGVLQFDFTGADQVTLLAGRLYAFEINGVANTAPFAWQRTTNDTYAGGAAYRNRSWINGNNAREFALAVYGAVLSSNATLVKVEAESGALGADWAVSNSVSPAYITITTDGAGTSPGSAARLASYVVHFPAAGSYDFYVRVRVGSGGFNDDSLFYANGFGTNDPANGGDWITVNGLGTGGFANASDVVTGGGSAGSGVWKWINLSEVGGGISFSVPSGSLTQTFQIGARENGLDWDAIAFGMNGVVYTVADLNAGVDGTLPDGAATLNWSDLRQRMDGFGAGVVFLDGGVTFTDARADTLFKSDTINQLALTLLRVRIEPNNSWTSSVSAWNGSVNDAKRAVARGAGVLATPWTPPAAMKTSTNTVGGSLLPDQYANYAAYLEKYASNMLANGVALRAVSVQNEPDWDPDYEGCVWTGAQFLSFFRTNASVIQSAPVMMPESLGFNFSYSDPSLNDAIAVTNIDLIGGHLYGVNKITPYNNAFAKGKRVWQTEYLENDQSVESAVETMKQIHDCLTTGGMSAYIWWKCLDDDNGLLNGAGVIQKRGYMLSQFSRFVRPGHERIGETNLGSSSVSAFRNPTNNNQFVIIAINPYSLAFDQTITLTNFPPSVTLTPWITSGTQSLAPLAAFTVTNGAFIYNLPPTSIITFVGTVNSNAAPVLAPVSPLTVNPGVTVLVTNAALDADVPAQTLTFTLLAAPTNATLTPLNASSARFTWRPLLSQSASTNTIQVKVADNGTPALSATNSFVITVNLASQPTLSSITVGGDVSLTATGMIGPDYALFTTTNLLNWELLFTTNPVAMPVTFTDTHRGDPRRFYRLELGP